jgi:hypothetical protein
LTIDNGHLTSDKRHYLRKGTGATLVPFLVFPRHDNHRQTDSYLQL